MPDNKNWTIEEIEELYARFRPQSLCNSGKTILIADADESTLNFLTNQLTSKGFSIISAENSLDTLLTLKKRKPDYTILDMNLEPISGIDLLVTIKQDPEYADIKTYISTTIGMEVDTKIAKIYGAVDVMRKPINTQKLIESVNSFYKEVPPKKQTGG